MLEIADDIVIKVQEDAKLDDITYVEIKEPYGFIYITTNLINGKRYLGKKKFDPKWENYLGSGTVFKMAVEKYKEKNFKRDIIDIAYSDDELNQKEYELSVFFNVVESDDWYNLVLGGGGTSGWQHSEESKKRMSELKKESYVGSGNPFYGKTHSDQTKQHLSDVRKGKNTGESNPNYGKHLSDETKTKIGQANKGKVLSPETREKISIALTGKMTGENHPMFGKHLSDEWKENISKSNSGENHWQFGKHLSEETKQKIREANSGEKSYWYGKHHSDESKQKISAAKIGHIVSEETRQKISITSKERYANPENHPMYGKSLSEDSKNKIRDTRLKNHSGCILVYCIELDRIFYGAIEASNILKIDHSRITKCCKGKANYCGRHQDTKIPLHWKYVYDQVQKDGSVIYGAVTLGYITEEEVDNYLNELI